MKSSLSKLRRFALNKSDNKDKIDLSPSAQVNELAQAAQDMQEIKDCYDSLLSAAAATANSAYEFSESLQEMGSCLLEKTSLHDDEASGNVLSMLGKVQFELQKLFDKYRSHIFMTITDPSESLLSELRTVEDMKRQCDEKREVYEYMMAQHKEKGRSKGGKGENFTLQQLQTAREEYDEEATLCIFRLKSLKQGQYRSLLTQAARHHAVQLNFFRKGLRSLEAVDAHVRLIAGQQHIDYPFCGSEDNDRDGNDGGGEGGNYAYEDGELSFDYRRNKQGHDVSTSRSSIEVDEVGLSLPQSSASNNAVVNLEKSTGDHHLSSREPGRSSYSAPILVEKKIDPAERIRQMQQSSSSRKLHTYVLPTPMDAKIPVPSRASTSTPIPHARPSNHRGRTHNLSHSSPLDQTKQERDNSDHIGNNHNNASMKLPPPLGDGLSLLRLEMSNSASDTKKSKRQAHSGPIASKPSSTKPVSSSGPIHPNERSQLVHPQPSTSPKVSPTASPPLVSSPRISELHELPRPPPGLSATKSSKSPPLVGHSAPLAFHNQEHNVSTSNNKTPSVGPTSATPLPIPPLIVPRSFSIPSSGQRAMALHVSKLLESPKVMEKPNDVSSPPLTPMSFTDFKPVPVVGSEGASRSAQVRGD